LQSVRVPANAGTQSAGLPPGRERELLGTTR
jgi:hypothetical protein